jgi:hypothetical protein
MGNSVIYHFHCLVDVFFDSGGIIQGVLLYTMNPSKTARKSMWGWDYRTRIIPLLSSMKPAVYLGMNAFECRLLLETISKGVCVITEVTFNFHQIVFFYYDWKLLAATPLHFEYC